MFKIFVAIIILCNSLVVQAKEEQIEGKSLGFLAIMCPVCVFATMMPKEKTSIKKSIKKIKEKDEKKKNANSSM